MYLRNFLDLYTSWSSNAFRSYIAIRWQQFQNYTKQLYFVS